MSLLCLLLISSCTNINNSTTNNDSNINDEVTNDDIIINFSLFTGKALSIEVIFLFVFVR